MIKRKEDEIDLASLSFEIGVGGTYVTLYNSIEMISKWNFLLLFFGLIVVCNCLNEYQRLSSSNLPLDNRVLTKQNGVPCREKNGRFPVSNQCDAYVECIDGFGEEKLCPEGLLFNPEARFNYPCGYPIDINCEGRPGRQAPQPTNDCPHQYGYFKIGDEKNCGQFMNCADGVGYTFDCPEGLAFNAESYRCDWPDQVPDCDAESFLGFRCPEIKDNSFLSGGIKFYRSNNDCQRYFICVNDRPRLLNCGVGNAFNELIDACDAAENVTGCEPGRQQVSDYQRRTKLF